MPLRESEAVVLRSFPLGEADRVVSFFSRSYGRVRGVARGARRPRSRFGAGLEPLSHVRIWYYQRETRELVRISQCELVESFLGAQRDYPATLALSAVVEITEAVLPEHEASDPMFRLLLATARGVHTSGRAELPLAYFCLWTVRLSGWLPALQRCAKCGRALGLEEAFATPAAAGGGGLACRKCRRPGLRRISAQSLAAARRMLSERLEQLLADQSYPGPGRDLTEYLFDVVEHQIERKLTTREMRALCQ